MDYGAVLIGAGALVTAAGALLTGVYTGRNNRAKDEHDAEREMARIEHANEMAIEEATQKRIEAIVQDNAALRKRMREAEDEHDATVSRLRRERQMWWDAAGFNYSLMSVLAHLLNNIFTVADLRPDDAAGLLNVVKNSRQRMKDMVIPNSLDESLDAMRQEKRAT